MNSTLTVKEKFSSWWSTVALLLGILTVVLYLGYLYIDSVVWEGILRLTAFILFAATVFSGLKVMEGKHVIRLDVEDGHLVVSYYRDDQKVQEDLFELGKIENAYMDRLPPTVFTNTLLFRDKIVMVDLEDTDRPLNLFELSGRVLSIKPDAARRVVQFIDGHSGNA